MKREANQPNPLELISLRVLDLMAWERCTWREPVSMLTRDAVWDDKAKVLMAPVVGWIPGDLMAQGPDTVNEWVDRHRSWPHSRAGVPLLAADPMWERVLSDHVVRVGGKVSTDFSKERYRVRVSDAQGQGTFSIWPDGDIALSPSLALCMACLDWRGGHSELRLAEEMLQTAGVLA